MAKKDIKKVTIKDIENPAGIQISNILINTRKIQHSDVKFLNDNLLHVFGLIKNAIN
jgi:hypothetical protein